MHSLDTGSICTSCGELTQGFNVHGQRLFLSSLSVPPAQDVTLLVIRLHGVGFGVQFSHSIPRSCSFFCFYTQFGFLFSLSHFIIVRVTLCVSIHSSGDVISLICAVSGGSGHCTFITSNFLATFCFFSFSSCFCSHPIFKDRDNSAAFLPIFLPLGPVPFYYHSSGTDKQLLGGCLTFYK